MHGVLLKSLCDGPLAGAKLLLTPDTPHFYISNDKQQFGIDVIIIREKLWKNIYFSTYFVLLLLSQLKDIFSGLISGRKVFSHWKEP